jgi:hypothetical protein
MLCVIYGGERSVMADLDADPTWRSTASGEAGSCELQLTRESAVWARDVLNPRGEFLVEVLTPVGSWPGVANRPNWRPGGCSIELLHINRWLGTRRVTRARRFYGVTPGHVVRQLHHDCFAGLAGIPIKLGPVLAAPPLVDHQFAYDAGSSAQSILSELARLSGQHWRLDESYRLSWVAREGRYHERWLIDDERIASYQADSLEDAVSEWVEIDASGRVYTSVTPQRPRLWPLQAVEGV